MPLELSLDYEQEQREEQGRIAEECREEGDSAPGYTSPSLFDVSSPPYFPKWFLASHSDFPEIPCGQGSSPAAAIEDWIETNLCPCGRQFSGDCNCPF
ncbi:MAG: hypothetical protein MH252_21900 [Thermosynechococcaceae cyanobacterium MS004]|nr:hypothetical protein [Thermosynechococcaceae cyanobacterium MS004]